MSHVIICQTTLWAQWSWSLRYERSSKCTSLIIHSWYALSKHLVAEQKCNRCKPVHMVHALKLKVGFQQCQYPMIRFKKLLSSSFVWFFWVFFFVFFQWDVAFICKIKSRLLWDYWFASSHLVKTKTCIWLRVVSNRGASVHWGFH